MRNEVTKIPPYLHPDGTSILTAKPDHPATVEHLVERHGFTRDGLTDAVTLYPVGPDLEQWHSMAHSEPRIETAITAALQLGADLSWLGTSGIKVRVADLLDLLGEAKEENDRLRGIIQSTIDFYREEQGA